MDSFKTLQRLTRKTAPGRPPDFTPAHIYKSIELISKSSLGRKQLSAKLGLGEGTVRTLVRRLGDENLIETSRSGMCLTSEGIELWAGLCSKLSGSSIGDSRLTVGNCNYVVLVRGSASLIRYGVEQRDAALLAGARGATTLVVEGGRVLLRELDEEIEGDLLDRLFDMGPCDGDVFIIGSADGSLMAEIGALSAAFDLLGS